MDIFLSGKQYFDTPRPELSELLHRSTRTISYQRHRAEQKEHWIRIEFNGIEVVEVVEIDLGQPPVLFALGHYHSQREPMTYLLAGEPLSGVKLPLGKTPWAFLPVSGEAQVYYTAGYPVVEPKLSGQVAFRLQKLGGKFNE